MVKAVTAEENAFSTCLQRSIDLLNAVAMHYQNGFMLLDLDRALAGHLIASRESLIAR